MSGMATDARRAVASGLTTPHEIMRLIGVANDATLPCVRCSSAVPLGAVGCPACGVQQSKRCACGERLEDGWRFCPWCVRPVHS